VAKPAPIAVDLPKDLIERYKAALAAQTDLRLVILLAFNSLEEVMKSFLAWRLSCSVDQLVKALPLASSGMVFRLVLIGQKNLARVEDFASLRNKVAHKFQLNDFEPVLQKFLAGWSNDPYPQDEAGKCKAVIGATLGLALDIAYSYLNEMPDRAEFPFPFLSLELASSP
jgi:hypothetical protein